MNQVAENPNQATKNDAKEEKAQKVEQATALEFKIKKLITVPLLKFVIDHPIYVRIDEPMYVGRELKGGGETAKMEAATLCNCTNLENGEICQIIVATVLKSILNEEFPDNSYVGKGFRIIKGAKGSGKGYNPYQVAELEI